MLRSWAALPASQIVLCHLTFGCALSFVGGPRASGIFWCGRKTWLTKGHTNDKHGSCGDHILTFEDYRTGR